MNYITITTPDNIEVEYRLAGAGSRLAAVVIDLAVLIASLTALTAAVLFLFFGQSLRDLFSLNLSGWIVSFAIISYFVIIFGYFIAGEIFLHGRSLGKMVFKLRVIRENGMPVSFTQSFVRNLFRYFVDIFGIGIICIMFSKKFKRVGDMLASTIVVAENTSRVSLNSLISGSGGNKPDSQFRPVGGFILSTEEQYFIREFFYRRQDFLDGGESLERKICGYISKKYDVPENLLNADVLYEILKQQ